MAALKDTHLARVKELEEKVGLVSALLRISMEITRFNEGYIGLKRRADRADGILQAKKLEEVFQLYKVALASANASRPEVADLVRAAENIADILVLYSSGKDICDAVNSEKVKKDIEDAEEVVARAALAKDADASKPLVKQLREMIGEARALTERKRFALKCPIVGGGSAERIKGRVKKLFSVRPSVADEATKTYSDTLLAMLIINLKRESGKINTNEFLGKIADTIHGSDECGMTMDILKMLVDETMEQSVKEGCYVFSRSRMSNECLESLEQTFDMGFTDEEKRAVAAVAAPIVYYSNTPEEFREVLGGSGPYFLASADADADASTDSEAEAILEGISDMDHEEVVMTPAERRTMEKGGLPLGAILFMYLVALREKQPEASLEDGSHTVRR